ncbi:NADH-quinone oxidoreductase subunit A [Fodinicola feengrottensis]|uniref:NADH-quinone oxidoreductase subunit n=1 Tax=Fodinicola feengrottensis TaxID=435914 RepID=A0ABN2G8G0_9ACTN|nr:NADH-quinone oxidoreductase subunit A [Fodinicola feengrottensis]
MDHYFSGYALVGLLIVLGIGFVATSFGANALLRPSRPSPGKQSTYECGVEPTDGGWAQSYIRYYVFAYLYVVFAVDAVFVFPWATILATVGFGTATLLEMFVFLGVLATGICYTWRKGVLSWV